MNIKTNTMKRLFYLGAMTLLVASCSGEKACDYSTPDGAAECACGFTEEYKAAFDAHDEAKMKEIDSKMSTWETEVEKHMEAGDYTENDVEAALGKKGCEM